MKKVLFILMTLVLVVGLVVPTATLSLADGQSGTTLSADVTAGGNWTRTFGWTIDKSVTPDTWNLFRGDSGNSSYTITVTKDSGTEEAWVEGTICVTNGGAVATENLTIVAELKDGYAPPNDFLASASVDVSSNPVLDPGETGCYYYSVDIPITDGAFPQPHAGGTYKVTANVTITNHSGHLGEPFGPSPSATTTFPGSPTPVHESITVDDTNGGSWGFDDSDSVSYEMTFTCDADEGTLDNTATIRETGQSDDGNVTVNCYALQVTKTAVTSFTRTYEWTIDKWGNETALTLAVEETASVDYEVTVDASYGDSDWAVSGNITVYNPAPISATINSVSDVVSPAIVATVDFGSTSFPYTLAAGGSLEGNYTASLPDATQRTNTATATLQNYDYDYQLNATPSGTTDFTGTADVVFGDPTEVDECIDVSDTPYGDLGTVCYEDVPETFYYSQQIGPYEECGDYTFENTASFVTNDTGATDDDSWTVDVEVPCAQLVGILHVDKFYDTDLSGVWSGNIATEPLLSGWRVSIGNGTVTKIYCTPIEIELPPGTYTVTELMPNQTNWVNTTPTSYNITIGAGDDISRLFGNVCLGAGGGKTLGFWSNKNGQALFGSDDLAAMVALNLRNGDGTNFNPANYSAFRTWLLGAKATNMAYMLSAQLAAMKLNVFNGLVSGTALVYAPGATSANALGFTTVNALMAEANAELGLHGSTLSGSAYRAYQECLKNALDKANNNMNFVSGGPCAYTFSASCTTPQEW